MTSASRGSGVVLETSDIPCMSGFSAISTKLQTVLILYFPDGSPGITSRPHPFKIVVGGAHGALLAHGDPGRGDIGSEWPISSFGNVGTDYLRALELRRFYNPPGAWLACLWSPAGSASWRYSSVDRSSEPLRECTIISRR